MITEQQLKSDCTPEIIKRMVELAEGFWLNTNDEICWNNNDDIQLHCTNLFGTVWLPLIIHRAVEGWNKKFIGSFIHINITHRRVESFVTDFDKSKFYEVYDYQPSSLTHCECACLHCLIEVLK